MRERLYRVEAVILKRTDVGEADRLLTLFTPERGKLRAVAKGARKPSSRKTGHVELFNHVSLLIAVGRDLDIVTQADTVESFLPLRRNLDRLSYAYYFAELVDRFTEEEAENRAVYDLILRAFHWLETTAMLPRPARSDAPTRSEELARLSVLARHFELHLLDALGYRPQLYRCVNCGEELQPEENFFSAEGGGVLNPKCHDSHRDARAVSLNALKVLRFLQSHEYAEVEQLRLTTPVESEAEELLNYYLTHLLERKLKSVEFLNTLRANTVSPVVTELH
jgi:DNA repair protein RecO (recombination protein O)